MAKFRVVERDAHIPSPEYRYWLLRRLMPPPGVVLSPDTVLWIMLNPSTADASKDDATIRRCMGFTFGWGFARMVVVNLFAYRSTNPAALWKVADPIGPENDRWISEMVKGAAKVVAAWGANGMHLYRDADVVKLVAGLKVPLWCLGKTKNGAPKHPVRLAGTTVLQEV